MLRTITQLTQDKEILILGFGKEGRSTYSLLKRIGNYRNLSVADRSPFDFQFDSPVRVVTGPSYQKEIDEFDIVFKSPGVILEKNIQSYRSRITSQTEMFMSCYSRQTIGITGTKGKSTTASLLYHIMKKEGLNCILAGNIGVPVFDIFDLITDDTLIINELSSHQLEHIKRSPHIAILINIYEDHIDHYGSYSKYVSAKNNIFKHQNSDDFFICNIDFLPAKYDCNATIFSISSRNESADIQVSDKGVSFGSDYIEIPGQLIKLAGRHNRFNIGIVFAVCKLMNLTDKSFLKGLCTYEPLPHRLENIGTFEDITYYDDSISTICEATIQAINSLPEVDSVLIGGMDRGIDYNPLVNYLPTSSVRHIILMYDSGKRIYTLLREQHNECFNDKNVVVVDSLKDAVKRAKSLTRKGKACLLSPAAPSFGHFRDFNERGDLFKTYIKSNISA